MGNNNTILYNNHSLESNVVIQKQDFNYQEEYLKLINSKNSIGAVVTFCGLVRDFYINANNSTQEINSIFLECYTQMAKKVIGNIILEAKNKFNFINAKVVHRVGLLNSREQIVFVGVTSLHRKNAFLSCEYIIDFLKVKAPFWKKEISNNNSLWVEQKLCDLNKIKVY